MASGRKKHNDSAHQSTPRSVKERALPHYKIAPGPSGHFLLGSTRDIRHDPLRFGLEMVWQYGDIVRIRVLLWPAYLVNHPDGVKHVLQENQRNYHKDLYPYRILKPLLGQGLVTNDGESWLQQRRLMQPAFHRKRRATSKAEKPARERIALWYTRHSSFDSSWCICVGFPVRRKSSKRSSQVQFRKLNNM